MKLKHILIAVLALGLSALLTACEDDNNLENAVEEVD